MLVSFNTFSLEMVDVVKTEMAAIRQANNYHRDMAVQEMCIYNLRQNYDKSMILQSITGFSGTPPDMIRYFFRDDQYV